MRKRLSGLVILLLLCMSPARAAAEWVFQLSSGNAWNIPMHLVIKQEGEEDISLTAKYETRAWTTEVLYYDFRVGNWKNNRAWELEFLHHKLFLSNKPPEVEDFAISHGYNLVTVNRAWLLGKLITRIGFGVVITHPETSVRGRSFKDEGGIFGFHFGGVTGQVAVERRFPLGRGFFFSGEAKLTGSYAEIPIDDGRAKVPNAAFHALFGIGYGL